MKLKNQNLSSISTAIHMNLHIIGLIFFFFFFADFKLSGLQVCFLNTWTFHLSSPLTAPQNKNSNFPNGN